MGREDRIREKMQEDLKNLSPIIEKMTNLIMDAYQSGFKTCYEIMTGQEWDPVTSDYKVKLSELLAGTSDEKHLAVHIPLELNENQGLSTLQMLTITEIWRQPDKDTFGILLEGCPEPQDLDNYKECIPYVYNQIYDQFSRYGLRKN